CRRRPVGKVVLRPSDGVGADAAGDPASSNPARSTAVVIDRVIGLSPKLDAYAFCAMMRSRASAHRAAACRSSGVSARRNPTCDEPVSGGVPRRALGRELSQYDGLQTNQPPLITR